MPNARTDICPKLCCHEIGCKDTIKIWHFPNFLSTFVRILYIKFSKWPLDDDFLEWKVHFHSSICFAVLEWKCTFLKFFSKNFFIHSNKANLCGEKLCKIIRYLHFPCKRFGKFRKIYYLCTRFGKMACWNCPTYGSESCRTRGSCCVRATRWATASSRRTSST